MHSLRTLLFLTLLFAPLAAKAQAPLPELVTEATFEAATAKVRKEGRLLFLQFKSSTCSHCKKFKEQVLDTAVFREFAAQHLVILAYDIHAMDALPESEQKLERELESKFEVESTPTIVIISAEGKQLLRTQGYGGTPAEKIVANLKALLEQQTAK